MCGYNEESDPRITPDHLLAQFHTAMEQYRGEPLVKVYTSGSFLDPGEVPPPVASSILETLRDRAARVVVESLPGYVTQERIAEFARVHPGLEVAIGLESANQRVLSRSVHKAITPADFLAASDVLHNAGVPVRAYLLLKPPFLTEREAILDTLMAARFAAPHAQTISINPVNVQRGTVLETLWRRWQYRPPWLWSLVEVLQGLQGLGPAVVCAPTGGGQERGVHNCGRCDGELLRQIEAFHLSQDWSHLAGTPCSCREQWEVDCSLEPFAFGAVNLEKWFRAA